MAYEFQIQIVLGIPDGHVNRIKPGKPQHNDHTSSSKVRTQSATMESHSTLLSKASVQRKQDKNQKGINLTT